VAKKNNTTRREVSALRDEVKNLASQLNTAVLRIQELEGEKKKSPPNKPAERELTLQEEVQALREEVMNLAAALNTAVERVCDLEDK
jgi:predicted  nucleic acid-binding Zn-ribbon protein